MSQFRAISPTFWTDSKVDDDFTPQDKFFYLYLLTNPHTNISGCYEVSLKAMERETGYNEDTVRLLIRDMTEVHKVAQYNPVTKEILILKWYKYNWSKSEKLASGVIESAKYIKDAEFRRYVISLVKNLDDPESVQIPYTYPMDTVSIPYTYPMDTSGTGTGTGTVSVSGNNNIYNYTSTEEVNNNDTPTSIQKPDTDTRPTEKAPNQKLRPVDRSMDTGVEDVRSDVRSDVRRNGHTENCTLSDERVCRTKDVRRIIEAWNSIGLTPIKGINPDTERAKQVRKRVKDYGVDEVVNAILSIKDSPFLCGQNKKGFMATFDWFIAPNNFIKVAEGNYLDRPPQTDTGGGGQRDNDLFDHEAYQAAIDACVAAAMKDGDDG